MSGTFIGDGMDWLRAQKADHDAEEVEYRRGVLAVTLDATMGRQAFRITDPTGGTRVERTDLDILLAAADLVLDGETVLPQRGDEVRRTVGSETWVYEVLAPGGEAPWRWSDSHHTTLRVHLKHVGTE